MLKARRYDSHRHAVGTTLVKKAYEEDSLTSAIDSMNLQDRCNSETSNRSSDQIQQTELQRELDRIFEKQAREKFDYIPEYEMPSQFRPGLTLFDHQKEGIRWLIHQERSGGAKAFFNETQRLDGTKVWQCNISEEIRTIPPNRSKGSILADGKWSSCKMNEYSSSSVTHA